MKTIEKSSQPRYLLLVEDSPGDIRLAQEALRDANPYIHLYVVSDGLGAMSFLRRERPYLNAPRPELILLDLNLPKMHGHEILERIKQDENLRTIPTIILTSSDLEVDIIRNYQFHANCYVRKPEKWDVFARLVKILMDFWLITAKLPGQKRQSSPVLLI